jgi:hypothetical protein
MISTPRLTDMISALCVWLAALGLVPGTAEAFGSIRYLGQHAEHEQITRMALGEFEPLTLDELAGKPGRLGALESPDNPFRGLTSLSEAHCDNGDYLDSSHIPGAKIYPKPQATARKQLEACRSWIFKWLNQAVTEAAPLLKDMSNKPRARCRFDGKSQDAKCRVLEALGIALHASQDFYSHSNWVDQSADTPINAENPPGLANEGRAPWLDPRSNTPFPDGLISGCYEGFPENFYCTHDGVLSIRHSALSKDNGLIDKGKGDTPRGRVKSNFSRAVAAAAADSKDKWAYVKERLIHIHGQASGARIICVLTHDTPATCPPAG